MFGFGRRGKVKKSADQFVEAMVMQAENSSRPLVGIVLQSLMDEDVDPERAAAIVSIASPSYVCFAALFSFELIKVAHAFDGELKDEIVEESLKAIKRKLHGETGNGMRIAVDLILENIGFQNSMMPLGEETNLELVGWNTLKFYGFEANPEIRQLMDNSACKERIKNFLEKISGSWWVSAQRSGAF